MKKKFDIRKTFEIFLKEPLSILTEGLFQIVNLSTTSVTNKKSEIKMWGKTLEMKLKKQENNTQISIDSVGGKTQITVLNNDKMYNLFRTVMYKRQKLGLTK